MARQSLQFRRRLRERTPENQYSYLTRACAAAIFPCSSTGTLALLRSNRGWTFRWLLPYLYKPPSPHRTLHWFRSSRLFDICYLGFL